MSQESADLGRLKAAADQLSEHFDSVMIFATRCETGELSGTVNVAWGAGNWFARYGQVRNWLVKEEESTREDVRGRSGDQD